MLLMSGKEDHACERHELLWVYSAFLPARSLLLTAPALQLWLSTTAPSLALSKEADDPKQKGYEVVAAPHRLSRLPTSRAAWAVVTCSDTDLS